MILLLTILLLSACAGHSLYDFKEGGPIEELTDANFNEKVLTGHQLWVVEFYAPWCGHCKALAPEWVRASNELEGKFNLGAVDATVHQNVAQRYGVRGYPTIKYFPPGNKDQPPEDYQGGRTANDIGRCILVQEAKQQKHHDRDGIFYQSDVFR